MIFREKTAILTGILLAFFLTSNAQNHLKKGWNYVNENKLDDARDEFYDASKNPSTAQEAELSWALINVIDKEEDESFIHFKTFIMKEKDPNPYLYNYWHGDLFVYQNKLSKDRLALVKDLLKSGKLNFTIEAFANRSLGRHYNMINKFKTAKEYYSKLGNIINWQLVGNFDNISGSGFNKEFGPLEHPENDYEFTNKNGAPIKWFTLKRYLPGKYINIGYHTYTDNSISYAQTFINSPDEKEVIVNIGVTGSLKVWLNDKEIFSQEEEREVGLDAYRIKVKLAKGYNRLLLKVGASDDVDNSNFFVRLSDLNDKLLVLETTAEPQPYDKSLDYTAEVLPHFAEEFFKKKYDSDKNNILNLNLLQDVYQRLDKKYKARKLLLEARKKVPHSTYFALQLLSIYSEEDAQTLYSKLLEEVKKTDPDCPYALSSLYSDAMDKEDWEEAEKYVDALEEVVGLNEDVYKKRINLLLKQEKTRDAIDMIFEGQKKYPDDIYLTYMAYLVYTKAFSNKAKGIAVLKAYSKNNFSTDIEELIADFYDETGNNKEFFKTIQKLIDFMPYTPGYYKAAGDKYSSMNSYSSALTYYEKMIENAPYVGFYHSLLAKAYEENDDEMEADDSYKKAILYSPNDYDTRKKYRKFAGKKDVFDYFSEPDVYDIYKKSASADDYPEDNSLIVYDETQKIVYKAGGSEEKHYLIVKVFNKTGVDTWKDYTIYDKGEGVLIEKAEVLKKNGESLKAEINEDNNRIIFTDLEEGDAILIIYKLQSYQSGKLLKHFWDKEYFDTFYPTSTHIYSLLVEGDRKFDYVMTDTTMKPEISKPDDDFTKYVWKMTDLQSIKDEKYMPNVTDFGKVLHYSSIPDWDFISKWYHDISTTKAKANFEVKDVLNNILKGKENLSDYQKVHLIYDYVVKEIRYSSVSFRQSGIVPQKASKTINTKIGDCKDVATLFIALCREAGYKAQMILVNTRDNGTKDLIEPNIGFNHAISKVWIDGKAYIVELTSDFLPFSTMGPSLKGAFALDINDEKKKSEPYLLHSKTRQANSLIRRSEVSFDKEGNMSVYRNSARLGSFAAGIRSTYRDIGQKKRLKELTKAISGDFAKIKVIDMKFDSALYTTADTVNYEYNFTVYDPFVSFENKKLLKIPFSDPQKPMDFLNDDRKYPLELWVYTSADLLEETIVIHTPKGMALTSVPKDKHYVSKFGEYSLTFKKQGRDIKITRRKTNGKDEVLPSEFQEFADFYKKIIKADETQLGYRRL